MYVVAIGLRIDLEKFINAQLVLEGTHVEDKKRVLPVPYLVIGLLVIKKIPIQFYETIMKLEPALSS